MNQHIETSHPSHGRSSRLTTAILLAALVGGGIAGLHAAKSARAADAPDWGPQWTTDGRLQLPQGYHRWVFLGAPLTPHGLNDGKAGFPEFHNVYVQPEAYQAYRETGAFPEGTILLKELQLTLPGTYPDGSRNESSGRGYFPGKANGVDISVKDSQRFADTNGWGFFNFGHHAPPYEQTAALQPKEACAGCHEANATDMVFRRFYTAILDAE